VSESSTLETLVKRDRAVVLAGLAGVTGLAWAYLFVTAAEMGGTMDAGAMVAAMQIRPWTGLDFLLMFLMWAVMMVAMMLPSAAPMILLFAALRRKQAAQGRTFAPVGAFVAGYLAVWSAFSLGATLLQWGLEQAALLSPMMVGTSSAVNGVVLIAAGIYQWHPWKASCLQHCQAPATFLTRHKRPGLSGAFLMGLHHGAFCLGCCWLLMLLLFVGGVMNLLWIALLAVFVLVEKLVPWGANFGRISGALMLLAGLVLIFQ
jgi:predicted metal-binding membrane protein